MFKQLKDLIVRSNKLAFDKSGQNTSLVLKVGTAAMLWKAASAGGCAKSNESRIIGSLAREFNISVGEAAELLSTAKSLAGSNGNLHEFIHGADADFSSDQKERLLSLVSKVGFISGSRGRAGRGFIAELENRLGLESSLGKAANAG